MTTLKLKIFKKYVYTKLCINRTMSHIATPLSILDKALMVLILLKISGSQNYYVLVALGGIIIMLGMFAIGHLDLKYGLAETEQSLQNAYNPELMSIYNGKQEKKHT